MRTAIASTTCTTTPIAAPRLIREVEKNKPTHGEGEQAHGSDKPASRQTPRLRFKWVPRIENDVHDYFAETDVPPLFEVILEPCMGLIRSNAFRHFKAPALRSPGPWGLQERSRDARRAPCAPED